VVELSGGVGESNRQRGYAVAVRIAWRGDNWSSDKRTRRWKKVVARGGDRFGALFIGRRWEGDCRHGTSMADGEWSP
jgi:hypothetical protein